jgi:fluoride ion exporter CrcB/FEX
MMLTQSAGQSLQASSQDRLFWGAVFGWQEHQGVLWPCLYIQQWIGWTAMALAAMAVWAVFFPALPQFRLLAGWLAVAPVICQIQMLFIGNLYLIQVAVVYLGLITLYRCATSDATRTWKGWLAGGSVGLAVFLFTLLTEYTVPGSLAAAVVLWFLLGQRGIKGKNRLLATGLLPAAALAGYLCYSLVNEAQVRPDVRPEKVMMDSGLAATAKLAGRNLVNDLWQLAAGRTLQQWGSIQFEAGKKGLMVIGGAALGAIALLLASRRQARSAAKNGPSSTADWKSAGVLLGAIAMGLLPVVLMGRAGHAYKLETRYWLPVMPLAACLTLAVFASVCRRQFASSLILGLGFLCGYTTLTEFFHERGELKQAQAWGVMLRPRLSDNGLNVAYVVYDTPQRTKCLEDIGLCYEMTARMTQNWSAPDRNRFWAWVGPASNWGYEIPNPPSEMNLIIRKVERRGKVARSFLINVDSQGHLRRIQQRDAITELWSDCSP